MKGFVKTFEAVLGTLIALGIIVAFASEDIRDPGKPFAVENVDQQLDTRGDILSQTVEERNVSVIKEELDTTTFSMNASIRLKNRSYSSSTDTSFTESFEIDENSSGTELFLWGDGQEVTVSLNGETFYTGPVIFERVSLNPDLGQNSLEVDNPSGQRFSVLLSVEERHGEQTPDLNNVYVVRDSVQQDGENSAEVSIYLWQ